MANYLDKVTVQTPGKRLRDFDISCQHLTTSTFLRPTLVYHKEFIPGSKIKMNLKSYVRMQPLYKPVLGSVQVRNRGFFVPMRIIWDPFNAFIVDAPYIAPQGPTVMSNVPTISASTVKDVFLESSYGLGSLVSSSDSFDLTWVESSGSSTRRYYYAFSDNGRQAWKLLNSLGYKFSFSDTLVGSQLYSFLPLLSVAKVFVDWYYPAQYAHSGFAASIDGMCHRNFLYISSQQDVYQCLLAAMFVFYDNDYFTSCWDNPVSPANGTFSNFSIPDVTFGDPIRNTNSTGYLYVVDNVVSQNTNGTPYITGVASSSAGLSDKAYYTIPTQYSLDALRSLTNYTKRHQLVGARVLERYLADFGIGLNSEQLMRSTYLGSQVFPCQFSDVMSNSDSDGAVLGEYAGKGLAFDGDGSFEYDTDEFGYFFVVNSFVPDIAYYQGVDRNVLHISKLDFFNSEFERLGTQPVLNAELFMSVDTEDNRFEEIFGYLPLYSEYKCGFDRVTGDFVTPSRSAGLMAWSTARSFSPSTVGANAIYHSHGIEFMRGIDNKQFLRVFYGFDEKLEIDPFIVVHRCNVKVAMPAMPMYDTYEFDEPEGSEIHIEANGSQLN